MRLKEMLKNKKLLTLIIVIIVIVFALIILVVTRKDDEKSKIKADYYYKYSYDDNLVTQSVWIYNNEGELQTKYVIIKDDQVISYTKGEKAVLVMQLLDLKDHPVIQISFEDDEKEKKHNVVYREEEV